MPEAPPNAPTVWAIAVDRDRHVDSTLQANASRIDAVVSSEWQLDSLTGQPVQLHSSTALPSGMRAIGFVSTRSNGRYHPEAVRRLAASASALQLAASRLGALVPRAGQREIILDFGEQSRADLAALTAVTRTLRDTLRAHGIALGLELPGADTATYPTRPLLAVADFLVVALDDEHWPASAPGPIASPAWVRRTLAKRVADVGPDKLVALLPAFSYVWRGTQPAELLSFSAARRLAAEASVDVVRDPASRSLHAVQPGSWELWLTDASLLNALEAEVGALGVQRIALRQLGLEDPRIWGALSQTMSRSR